MSDTYTSWTLLFDGSRMDLASGCGIVMISLEGQKTLLSFQFDFDCTNNQAEYKAVIIGLQIIRELGMQTIEVFGDSQLVINHFGGTYKCHSPDFALYYIVAKQLLENFDDVILSHVPRRFNTKTNELAYVAIRGNIPQGVYDRTIIAHRKPLPFVKRRALAILDLFHVEISESDWRHPLIQFLKYPNLKAYQKTKRRAVNYVLMDRELYKKSPKDDLCLRCLS
ncbi:uncharacterized protein LOC120003585 [Tripterygium wilfordii]|uniref:uncharacterized protein LOC120003585 n=1 Tax=Tripterygium wilfordii TaxID=458696 RepID=UPI0018F80EFB|nr:uncharacterized protein LOC120003585 [Tripterygium wilfordii]